MRNGMESPKINRYVWPYVAYMNDKGNLTAEEDFYLSLSTTQGTQTMFLRIEEIEELLRHIEKAKRDYYFSRIEEEKENE